MRPSSDHQHPHPAQFQEQEKGKRSHTLIKIEAFAHCEWEQMKLRSSLASNAGKQNASSSSLMAESQHSFWLYVHAVDTCNNCEKLEIICWALTLIGGPGSMGVRQ